MIAQWFHQFPVYVQFILALVMTDWLGFQCWQAQRVLGRSLETRGEKDNI